MGRQEVDSTEFAGWWVCLCRGIGMRGSKVNRRVQKTLIPMQVLAVQCQSETGPRNAQLGSLYQEDEPPVGIGLT